MEIAQPDNLNDDCNNDNLFGVSAGAEASDPPAQAVVFLHEELEIELSQTKSSMAFQCALLFLGHGVKDEKMPVELECFGTEDYFTLARGSTG